MSFTTTTLLHYRTTRLPLSTSTWLRIHPGAVAAQPKFFWTVATLAMAATRDTRGLKNDQSNSNTLFAPTFSTSTPSTPSIPTPYLLPALLAPSGLCHLFFNRQCLTCRPALQHQLQPGASIFPPLLTIFTSTWLHLFYYKHNAIPLQQQTTTTTRRNLF